MKQLNDKVNLAVRRCQIGTSKITVAQVRNSDSLDNMVKKMKDTIYSNSLEILQLI